MKIKTILKLNKNKLKEIKIYSHVKDLINNKICKKLNNI